MSALQIKQTRQQPATPLPLLWSPLATVALSFLFTPVFGAAVQMLNWRALHEVGHARSSFWWCMAGCVILLLNPGLALIQTDTRVLDSCTATLMLLYMTGWLFLSAGTQIRYVRRHFPQGYGHRSWKRILPLTLAACAFYLFMSLALTWMGQFLLQS